MKKIASYEAPQVFVVAILTESAILSASTEGGRQMGMQDLTYEDIQWN